MKNFSNLKIETIERMRSFLVIVSSIICLYVFGVKAYAICYDIYNGYFDITIFVTYLVIQLSCILILVSLLVKKDLVLSLSIWNKFICSLIIAGAIYIQLFVGLWVFLSKSPEVNQIQSVWLVDIPNLLSIILPIYTLMAICSRSRR